ncbi:sulfatase [Persicobacter diffluens]|uniref:Arylsulfatase n=1 Tax=Persicobacter diffluens TaxID=981 RepID=A0AAN4W1D5_9BACT|nr:arylsulfatase [Persicobacter diffluens]
MFSLLKSSLLALLMMGAAGLAMAGKPLNILWINCDDLGREVGCYGNQDVYTPHMDRLAKEGIRFLNAYANAPVCSASRSSQITGMYPSSVNCLSHRAVTKHALPEGIVPVMELFRQNGYFCTNGWAHNLDKPGKEDYNFQGTDFFDGTDWQKRKKGQPFFAQVQIHEPHRTFVHDPDRPVDPAKVQLPEEYPDEPLIRADWAMYLESVQVADKRIGKILERLEQEGELENTAVFVFGDHGRPHLRDKQWLYEGGLQIPLLVYLPEKGKAGQERSDLISLIDVTASSLALAGIPIPDYMQGKDVLGGDQREYAFGFRGRCGDADDDIRSVTDGRYKLIWNKRIDLPYMQLTSYKKLQYPAFTLYKELYRTNQLPAPYNQFMAQSRPEVELYDLQKDPAEYANLAEQKSYQKVRKRLWKVLQQELASAEKNLILESAAEIQRAKSGSMKYCEKGMIKRGLTAEPSDPQLLDYWESTLLKAQ